MNGPDADELERAKLAALAEFAAGAGHEINNPLAVITGRVQLLLRGERDPERRRDLAIIHTQAMRVHEMIADLMLFARPPEPNRRACDAAAIVEAAINGLRAKADAPGIALVRIDTTRTLPLVADAEQLQSALRAVIDNGLNAATSGGRVEIELRTVDGFVEFVVTDDGPGLSDADREHLFDPFYSGREAGRGLGVGLSKAWRFITNHGGTIAVESVEPHGARFTIRVPAKSQATSSND